MISNIVTYFQNKVKELLVLPMLDNVLEVIYHEVMDITFVENKLRRATKGQLLALNVIASSPNSLATTSDMQDVLYGQADDSSGTATQSVGGTISAVTRIKVDHQPLLIPMGKDEYGIRWQLNENIIKSNDLKHIVTEILESWK